MVYAKQFEFEFKPFWTRNNFEITHCTSQTDPVICFKWAYCIIFNHLNWNSFMDIGSLINYRHSDERSNSYIKSDTFNHLKWKSKGTETTYSWFTRAFEGDTFTWLFPLIRPGHFYNDFEGKMLGILDTVFHVMIRSKGFYRKKGRFSDKDSTERYFAVYF